MKRFSLLALLSLVAFVFAIACTDATSPNSRTLLAPKSPDLGFIGEAPPPPADVAVTFSISSDVLFSGSFSGVYFANPASLANTVAAAEVGDDCLTFAGTAWLRLDNKQPATFATFASANARFQTSQCNLSGHGTLTIAGHVVHITEVTSFTAHPDCLITGEICATVIFNATIEDLPGPHTGTAEAFNKESCELIPGYDPGEGPPVPGYYDCPGAGS